MQANTNLTYLSLIQVFAIQRDFQKLLFEWLGEPQTPYKIKEILTNGFAKHLKILKSLSTNFKTSVGKSRIIISPNIKVNNEYFYGLFGYTVQDVFNLKNSLLEFIYLTICQKVQRIEKLKKKGLLKDVDFDFGLESTLNYLEFLDLLIDDFFKENQ